MKKVTCPSPCDAVFEDEDEQALLEQVATHVKEVHPNMVDGKTDQELKQMAKALMTEE